jgi:putative sigma-54 modulation protein
VQIKISTRHGQISETTQQIIRDKADKLNHYFARLTMITITVDMKEENRVVEILVSAEHKHDFVASEKHKEVLTAVDMVIAKLEGQLRRYKEKIQDHRRAPSASEVAGAPALDEETEE